MNPCYWTALTLCTNFNLEKDSDDLAMKEFAWLVGLYCRNMEPSWIVSLILLENKTLFLNDVKVRLKKNFFLLPVLLGGSIGRRTNLGHHWLLAPWPWQQQWQKRSYSKWSKDLVEKLFRSTSSSFSTVTYEFLQKSKQKCITVFMTSIRYWKKTEHELNPHGRDASGTSNHVYPGERAS